MGIIDTHCHIYVEEFDADRPELIEAAQAAGIDALLLPNIDRGTVGRLYAVCDQYPDYAYPMMGLHPTSVAADYRDDLNAIESELAKRTFCGIGEIGIDLYWDKSFLTQQKEVFIEQLRWSIDLNLPVAIHTRDAFPEVFDCIGTVGDSRLKGVFHSFSGGREELTIIAGMPGFMIGINGVVTFKNSKLDDVIREFPIDRILLETDAPYLAPAPYRGRRNEPLYICKTAEKLGQVFQVATGEIIRVTHKNSLRLFKNVNNARFNT